MVASYQLPYGVSQRCSCTDSHHDHWPCSMGGNESCASLKSTVSLCTYPVIQQEQQHRHQVPSLSHRIPAVPLTDSRSRWQASSSLVCLPETANAAQPAQRSQHSVPLFRSNAAARDPYQKSAMMSGATMPALCTATVCLPADSAMTALGCVAS